MDCRNCLLIEALPGSDYCERCEHIAAKPVAPWPADALAAKLARIDALRTENAADYRPSFVALLPPRARQVAVTPQHGVAVAARICPVFRAITAPGEG